MKRSIFLLSLLVTLAVAQELELAETCDESACQLPSCRCSSTSIPGNLEPRDTPQFVLLTFDDAINIINIETYREELYERRNKNGCPIGTTFFISHEYTNYQLVNELYNRGFEIALHSITHQTPQTYWAEADYDTLMMEIGDQIQIMQHFANIPASQIKGVRMPFLQLSGNTSYQVMASIGLEYDCSWPTTSFTNPGLWPYTLDYASIQDCVVLPCPTASIPGVWVLPMVAWTDLDGFSCSMADSCFSTPDINDEDGWFEFMVNNFERHYLGNRAPFGFYMHQAFLQRSESILNAFRRFLDLLNNLEDVFLVNANEVIDWVKDPIPINEYRQKACRQTSAAFCPETRCGPLDSVHTETQFWMEICNVCPRVYPWLGNPLGQ